MPDPIRKAIESIAARAGFISMRSAERGIIGSESADPFTVWRGSKKVDPQKAFEIYSGWVYACIRAIAEELGKMRFKLMRVNKDGTSEEVPEHELLDLLEGVNPNMTGIELRYMTGAHLESIGNAYWFLEGVEGPKDKPKAIHIVDPSRTKVIVDRDHFPSSIKKYVMRTGTNSYDFKPEQLVHFRYPDPTDPFEGIGTVQTAAQWIDADNYAMEFNRRFFLNGARIGGFIESNAITSDQLEYLKKSFEKAFTGINNAYKVLALPQGAKFTEGSQTQKDLDFANMMIMMRDRILAAFRVPRTALGITDDVNRANAEATDYVFAARTIAPKMEMLCSFLNEYLVPRYGEDLYLTYEDPVPENREINIAEMSAALGTAPATSLNEAREKYLGLPAVEGGDEIMGIFSQQPRATVKAQKKEAGTRRRAAKPANAGKSRSGRSSAMRRSLAEEIASKMLGEQKSIEKVIKAVVSKKKDITDLTHEEYELIWKGFVARVDPYEKLMLQKIRTFNAKQKKVVIENLSKVMKGAKLKKRAVVDELLDASDKDWIGILYDLTVPGLTELFSAEGKQAAQLLGIELDPLTDEVKKALEKTIELFSKAYNEETAALIGAKLEEGLSAGATMDELTGLVNDIYEFSDTVRAERVARTETFRIANAGTKEAWKQTGVVKSVKWYTSKDEAVCPYCDVMDGKEIGIDDSFHDKGDKVEGTDGSVMKVDFAEIDAPPLHVNCRCYIRPENIDTSGE